MIPASNITLCCIDTEHHALSAVALRRSAQAMQFGKIVFVTDQPAFAESGWELHRIKRFEDYEEFNRFVLKHLYYHIDTEYVLIIQFDGFVINPGAWNNEFLAYDYVGAPWHHLRPSPNAVGNGGFCLRSRRLLKALQDDRVVPTGGPGNEDGYICHTYRSLLELHHGITFAPVDVAERFSFETGPYVPGTFGFHGLMWLADVYVGEVAEFLTRHMQPYLLEKHPVIVLALQYAFRNQHTEAAMLFKRIAQHQSYEKARANLGAHAGASVREFFEEAWPRYVG